MQTYEYLRPFARSPEDHARLDCLLHNDTMGQAQLAYGKDARSFTRRIKALKAIANDAAIDEASIKRISTLKDYRETPTGETMLEWQIRDKSMVARIASARAAIDSMKDEIKPVKLVKPPKSACENLLNLYVVTDYHIGMLAWGEECGEDWDVAIAEDLLVRWFEYTIARSPDAEHAVFAQLGDFLHFDGLDSITPTSGHLLDSDTRFQRVVRIAIRVLRRVISLLLQKHKTVHVIMAEGNHDLASSAWLREMFSVLYENEPRITVDDSPDPYYCVEWGKTSLFFHHGHKKKMAASDSVFAAKFRVVWGRTKYSYAHFGHLHHVEMKETNLMVIEQHRTLAAKDAYASRGGWMSGRESSVITYHKDYGYSGRIVATPEMVQQ